MVTNEKEEERKGRRSSFDWIRRSKMKFIDVLIRQFLFEFVVFHFPIRLNVVELDFSNFVQLIDFSSVVFQLEPIYFEWLCI